jgi:hypothetical protein
MVSSVTQPLTDEQFQRTVEELYGDRPTLTPQAPTSLSTAHQRWPQAVTQVGEQLRVKLRVEVLPERMRKALELVRANAVTLQADGTARVKSGNQTYTLAPECTCADAQHRTEFCKHSLAVDLHRRALALVEGPAPAPAAPSIPPPAAAPTAAAPSAPASQAWDVHEAPASACFKFRVGNMELMYTLRGIDDDELQRRITATLPTLQDVIEACEERAAQRAAAREAQAAQAQQAPTAAIPQADLQALLQQAVQQALAAQANGQAHGTPPPAAPSTGPVAAPGGAPFCHVHQAPLELRTNDRGSWWSHWVASEKRYCKGE